MIQKDPFISIVMPIYNVENYLRQAIDSVLNQTFQDFEIILVDDCSPDKCPEICDEYASENYKISVIHHKKNRGLSGARNSGMQHARGRYIWFMDSDDYVDSDLLQQIYESVQSNPAKVVVFGLVEEYFDENGEVHHKHVIRPDRKYLKNEEEVREYIIKLEVMTLYGYAWNKFYDLDYLRKIQLQYENVTLIEDILFNVNFCMDIDKMNILDIVPYHYNKRMDNSLTAKFVPDYYELHRRRIEMVYEQYEYWNMCTEEVKSTLALLYTRYIFSALQRNCDKRSKMNHKDRKKWIHGVFKEEIFNKVFPYAQADSMMLNIMINMLKMRMTNGCVALGRIVYIVKTYFPMMFSKLKQKR